MSFYIVKKYAFFYVFSLKHLSCHKLRKKGLIIKSYVTMSILIGLIVKTFPMFPWFLERRHIVILFVIFNGPNHPTKLFLCHKVQEKIQLNLHSVWPLRVISISLDYLSRLLHSSHVPLALGDWLPVSQSGHMSWFLTPNIRPIVVPCRPPVRSWFGTVCSEISVDYSNACADYLCALHSSCGSGLKTCFEVVLGSHMHLVIR